MKKFFSEAQKMNKLLIFKLQSSHYIKILALYLIGYFLASHYRPIQNSQGFFDFGLADSGVGLVSMMLIYFLLTSPNKNQLKAKENALLLLFFYLSQEIFCYFFPGLVGTFDFKDLVYYVFGYILLYWYDVKRGM